MQSGAEDDLQVILRASEAPLYNTAAVARRCDMPAATVRAWERRYGFPEPRRGPGKQRLYSERDVLAIQWLRDRIAEGLTISAAVSLLREQLSRDPSHAPATTGASRSAMSPSAYAGRLGHALLAFDAARAAAILGEAFCLWPLEQA